MKETSILLCKPSSGWGLKRLFNLLMLSREMRERVLSLPPHWRVINLGTVYGGDLQRLIWGEWLPVFYSVPRNGEDLHPAGGNGTLPPSLCSRYYFFPVLLGGSQGNGFPLTGLSGHFAPAQGGGLCIFAYSPEHSLYAAFSSLCSAGQARVHPLCVRLLGSTPLPDPPSSVLNTHTLSQCLVISGG